MKRFLLKIGFLLLIIVILDVLIGKVFGYLVSHTQSGDYGRYNYICNKTHEDILVFGSSRAQHHYNPFIISDSLGLSCYNCGQRGEGIISHYGNYLLIHKRYRPRILIYDVFPTYDLFVERNGNQKFLGWLRLSYDSSFISEIFTSVDYTEKYKMKSQMYRYNSRFAQILFDYVHPLDKINERGFQPMYGRLDSIHAEGDELLGIDSLKITYIKRLLENAEDTTVIFVVSPIWNGIDSIYLQPIRDICRENLLPLIDFSNAPKYIHHNEYFYDNVHLNDRGADEFTRDLVQVLKERGVIQPK